MNHPEALLVGIFVALYLYDSTFLLQANEAFLRPIRRNEWGADFGAQRYTFKGQEIYLANPFLPAQPLFRLSWSYTGSDLKESGQWESQRDAFRTFAPWVSSLGAITFVLLPMALFGRLGDSVILWAFLLIYLNISLIVALLWFNRGRLELPIRAFVALAFECIVCPPFALNIIRRLSLRISVREDFLHAANRLLSEGSLQATKSQMLSRLDDEISGEDESSQRMVALQNQRQALVVQDNR